MYNIQNTKHGEIHVFFCFFFTPSVTDCIVSKYNKFSISFISTHSLAYNILLPSVSNVNLLEELFMLDEDCKVADSILDVISATSAE